MWALVVASLLIPTVSALTDADRQAAALQSLGEVAPIDDTTITPARVIWCTRDPHCRYFTDRDATCNTDTNTCNCGPSFKGPICSPAGLGRFRIFVIIYFARGICSQAAAGSLAQSSMKSTFNSATTRPGEGVELFELFCGSIVTMTQMKLQVDEAETSMQATAQAVSMVAEANQAFGYEEGNSGIEIVVQPLTLQETVVIRTEGCDRHADDSYEAPNGLCYVATCDNGYQRELKTDEEGREWHVCEESAVVPVTAPSGQSSLLPGSGVTDLQWAAIFVGILILLLLICLLMWFFCVRENDDDEECDNNEPFNGSSFQSGYNETYKEDNANAPFGNTANDTETQIPNCPFAPDSSSGNSARQSHERLEL